MTIESMLFKLIYANNSVIIEKYAWIGRPCPSVWLLVPSSFHEDLCNILKMVEDMQTE